MKYPNFIGSGPRVFIAGLRSFEIVFLPLSNQIVSRLEFREAHQRDEAVNRQNPASRNNRRFQEKN